MTTFQGIFFIIAFVSTLTLSTTNYADKRIGLEVIMKSRIYKNF